MQKWSFLTIILRHDVSILYNLSSKSCDDYCIGLKSFRNALISVEELDQVCNDDVIVG